MEMDAKTFGVVDYFVFIILLFVSTGIGIFMSFRGNKTPEDFLLGNRSFRAVPISLSLITSIISSIALLGFSGEVYAYGLQFSVLIPGITLALIFCYFVTLPVLFPLKLTSVNEYIELRFQSRRLRSVVLFLSCVQGIMYSGISLYAPTIALSSVTPYSTTSYIYLLGIICTLYSAIGGIKAVVWTDVFQLAVIIIGLLAVSVIGTYNLGGLSNVWSITKEGGRFDVFRMSLGIYERRTFLNVLLHGIFFFLAIYGTSQINIQRMNCLQTIQDAKLVILTNIIGYVIIYTLIFTCGIICYAAYAGCDPLMLGKITKIDQILTYFVVDKLGYITGLPGLFIATIIAGALSTVSSMISSQVSMLWGDALQNLSIIEKVSAPVAAFINKVLSIIVGSVMIGVALWASKTKSLLELTLAVSGASYGPILGLFMLGILFPKCNTKGAWCGLVISYLFVCWIMIGGFVYQSKSVPLPVSTDNCVKVNNITSSYDLLRSIDTVNDLEEKPTDEEPGKKSFPLMWLYGISTTLYPVIGPLVCVIVGLTVSLSTGSQSLSNVSPLLITPVVRRLYWDKQKLEVLLNAQR